MMTTQKLLRVKDDTTIARDSESKAIVNVDYTSLNEYKKIRQKRALKNKTILQYENDINTLKNEVSDIKDSLKLILERLTTNKG